jgi:hypothetical protein
LLTVTASSRRTAASCIGELTLATHFCRSDQRYRKDRFQDETVTRPFESQGGSPRRVLEDMFIPSPNKITAATCPTPRRCNRPTINATAVAMRTPSRCNAAIDSRVAVEPFAPRDSNHIGSS